MLALRAFLLIQLKRIAVDLILTNLIGTQTADSVVVTSGHCVTFGRTNASQKSFPGDTHMSSLHFEVENYGTWAEIRDKRSTNGTWLNNNRITVEKLKSGDQIRAGTTLFSVEIRIAPSGEKKLPTDLSLGKDTGLPNSLVDERDPNTPVRNRPNPQFVNPIQTGSHSPISSSDTSGRPEPAERASAGSGVFRPIGSDSNFGSSMGPGRSSAEAGHGLLNDIQRHLDKRLTPFADSIDISEVFKEEKKPAKFTEVPREAAQRDSDHLSPISDSSLFVPGSEIQPLPPQLDKNQEFDYQCLRVALSMSEALVAIVERLSREWSVQAVVHPQKIRQSLPGSLNTAKYLWECYGSSAEFGPAMIPWMDFKNVMLDFVPRLCSADGMIVFFGSDLNRLTDRLSRLSLAELQGFSEVGGFLNCFWPSSLVTILDARSKRHCAELFQDAISGLLMPSPWDTQMMLAVCNPAVQRSLSEFGFVAIDNFSDSRRN